MKNILIHAALGLAFVAFAGNQAQSQQILVSAEMQQMLKLELGKAISVYALDTEASARISTAIQSWLAGKADLGTAVARQSQRFPGRVTYKLQPLPNTAELADAAEPAAIINPDIIKPIIFRKDVNFYSYRQFELSPALSRLPKLDAIQTAKDLLVSRKMLELTTQDALADNPVVREFRRNRDDGLGGEGNQELLMQGVIFGRAFRGAPVINSRILVDILPDTKQVVGLRHSRWTPVLSQPRVTTLKTSTKTVEEVLAALRQRTGRYLGVRRATLSDVTPGWFQTDKDLVPILLCQVTVAHNDHVDGFCQPINLAGSDSVLYSQTISTQPPAAPVTDDLKLLSPRWVSSDEFTFGIAGQFTDSFVVEAAADITGAWVPVATNMLAEGQFNFTNKVSNENRFFRARSLP
jgi:hypothetical protein